MAILKTPRFWPALQFGRTAGPAVDVIGAHPPAVDGLDAFGSESNPAPASHPAADSGAVYASSTRRWVPAAAKWVAVIMLSVGVGVAAMFGYQRRIAPKPTTGTVTIETVPAGLPVVIAGRTVGTTPLTTSLAAGGHEVQVGPPARARTIHFNVSAGSSVVQRMEFAPATLGAAETTGGLRVQTEPAQLPVLIDGTARGVSPVALDNLTAGEHDVVVRTASGIVRRKVSIQPGETLSLLVSSAAPPADPSIVSAGWMSVSSPIPLQLREGGKLIGTSESDRLMLPAGDHDIEFANAALGFTSRKVVRVAAGKTAATKIDLPNGSLSINAQPWAEVWIDGERVGETPVGNLSRSIGTHEIVFRHPELGERRETVVVAVGKPTRIGVDLRKK